MIILAKSSAKPKFPQLPASPMAEPVITLNKQVISKVHFRKKWKVREQSNAEPTHIFGPMEPEY
jgi:hypothetical protein